MKGNIFIEFLGGLALVIGLVEMVVIIYLRFWHQAECRYWVFEKTHHYLFTKKRLQTPYPIQIFETPRTVIGIGKCGSIQEKVELPKLESAQW